MRPVSIALFGAALLATQSDPIWASTSKRAIPDRQKPDLRPYAGEESISPTFAGSNIPLLLSALVKADSLAKKGEFETTAEHQARTADLRSALAPVDPSKFYAMPLKGVSAKYDADREGWRLETHFGDGCTPLSGQPDVWSCKSKVIRTERGGYTGQNAYGATAEVERVTLTYVNFAISRTMPGVRDLFRQGTGGAYQLNAFIPMPVDKARQLAGTELQVFAIGSFITPKVLSDPIEFHSATISDPTDMRVEGITLPLLAQQFVIVAAGKAGAVATMSLTGRGLLIP